MSYLAQMLGLTVQNFVSAATGMAVLVALTRGIRAKQANTLGNFWVDLTRGVLYILLPLSLLLSAALVSQGVVQSLDPYATATLLEPVKDANGTLVTKTAYSAGACRLANRHQTARHQRRRFLRYELRTSISKTRRHFPVSWSCSPSC